MGWREGRGVGANRVKKPEPEKKGAVIGPMVPAEVLANRFVNKLFSFFREEEADDEETEAEVAAKLTIAPKNTVSVEYVPKNDHYGIGFDPYTAAPEFRQQEVTTKGYLLFIIWVCLIVSEGNVRCQWEILQEAK